MKAYSVFIYICTDKETESINMKTDLKVFKKSQTY